MFVCVWVGGGGLELFLFQQRVVKRKCESGSSDTKLEGM